MINYYKELIELELDETFNKQANIIGVKELYNKIGKGPFIRAPYLCSDIGSRLLINANGNVYPCPETIDDKYCIGNVNDEDFTKNLNLNRTNILNKLSFSIFEEKNTWILFVIDTCQIFLIDAMDASIRQSHSLPSQNPET